MTHVRSTRLIALGLLSALVLTACGQRPGVHVEGSGQVLAGGPGQGQADGASGGEPGTTTENDATTDGGGDLFLGPGGEGSGDDGGTQPAPGNGGGAPPPGNGDDSAPQPPPPPTHEVFGNDRTGVTDDVITVAFHAPVTGAAPLPAEAFERARDLYWRWHGEVKGREFLGRSTVRVLFQDDTYDPSAARQVCRGLANQAFIVAGGGGTDQIQACGQLAEVDEFLYFSAGVTEVGLETNPWYFAASMTYRQQGLLLAQYIKKNHPGKKIGAVLTRTANFDDAKDGFEQGIAQAGLGDLYVGMHRHPRGNDKSWINQIGNDLANDGAEVVYILTAPVDYIQFAQQNNTRNFEYVGVGVSMGLNAVLGSGCPEVGGGTFFSPFPGLDRLQEFDPDYLEAWRHFGIDSRERPGDLDLGFALWAINKQLDVMFQRYERTFGPDLTREAFRALVEGMGPIDSGIFPTVQYSQNNHFGGSAVHVLQADCSTGQHKTLHTFATGF